MLYLYEHDAHTDIERLSHGTNELHYVYLQQEPSRHLE
jgi:hypothetical protein